MRRTVCSGLLILAALSLASCEEDELDKYRPAPSEMRANLRNATLVALVDEGDDPAQQAQRVRLPGVRKDGVPLCEDLSVAELEARDTGGAFVNDCVNPDPPSYCQEIHPERLATGRVTCRERPWRTGELMAVDHDGEVFSVLPFLPEWNRVTRVQQSEGALLVTLQYPMKLLRIDGTEDYCHVLYYAVDTGSDAIVPYCFEYEYQVPFCFGPEQKDGAWAWAPHVPPWCVRADGEEVEYTERLEHLDGGPVVCASPPDGPPPEGGKPNTAVHVTPHALYESYSVGSLPSEGLATRIVTGDQEAHYPMEIDYYTANGIVSAGTYYTFDASHTSITANLSGTPISWNDTYGRRRTHESGQRILYGFWTPAFGGWDSRAMTGGATSLELHYFDTETLEDGSFLIGIGAVAAEREWWTFEFSLGDYLFLTGTHPSEDVAFFRVDTRSAPLLVEEIHRHPGWSEATPPAPRMVQNGWAVYAPSEVPFLAFLFKPDGTMVEVNAEMLGWNPQTLEIEDDLIVVAGMDGLTPRRFVIHPLATAEGELLVETPTDTIPVRTLIPLQ